ncbi:YqjF family protein [Frondihabitans cladoniiphilus]|uniref:DUF2071 domain-containing protein n=1 Tax=Frondihabitans cladoniiphilus TaxID=715785 RepID=A0ABP8WBL6_9MICO
MVTEPGPPSDVPAPPERIPSPTAPPLPHRPVTFHRQRDVVLLHWRVDPALVADLVPGGCTPDLHDGSAWVALTGYVFADSTVPPLPPLGRLGTMTEVTVEILTVDADGRQGIAYRSIDTQHLPAIAAARLGIGLPYTYARAGSRRYGPQIAHRTRRPGGAGEGAAGASARLRVRASGPASPSDPLVAFLTRRWGVHAHHLGRTSWWRLEHEPWVLERADVLELDETLLAAAGLGMLAGTPPDSVLCSTGADVRYSRG